MATHWLTYNGSGADNDTIAIAADTVLTTRFGRAASESQHDRPIQRSS